jgi:transcriptional regulator with XRE-family HTH domain
MPRENQDSFPTAVKIALVRKGMTVTDLAERLGKSRENVSRAIHNGQFPSINKRIRKALAL